jgi:hypothetical protein
MRIERNRKQVNFAVVRLEVLTFLWIPKLKVKLVSCVNHKNG